MTAIPIEHIDSEETATVQKEWQPSNPITKVRVQEICVKNGFYKTPSCNDKLYLHHKGFDQIAGLEEFTETRVLWLEGNCLRKIENLDSMRHNLMSLYLHENLLESMKGIEHLTVLDGLNVSDNYLRSIDLQAPDADATEPSPFDTLKTLQIKNNKLKTADDIKALLDFKQLAILDITSNELEDGEDVLSILEKIPTLKSLRMSGNPFVRKMSNYRRTVLSRCTALMHLDDRPVFADERRLVTAWTRGGSEEEKKERALLKKEEDDKITKRLEDFRAMVRAAKGDSKEAEESADSDSSESEDEDNAMEPATPSNKAPPRALTSNGPAASHHVDPEEIEVPRAATEAATEATISVDAESDASNVIRSVPESEVEPSTKPQTKFDALWDMARQCPDREDADDDDEEAAWTPST